MELDTIKNDAAEFCALVEQGIDCWVKAGQLVARQLDKDPSWVDRVCQLIPGMKAETIYRFDAIGRRQLSPRLMLATSPGHKALAQLPLTLQERYLNNPVPLLVITNGATDTLLVDVQNLTKEQCRQVFSHNAVRSEAEQRAWLEGQKTKVALQEPARIAVDYVIRGGSVHIQRPLIMTQQEVARLLTKMVGA